MVRPAFLRYCLREEVGDSDMKLFRAVMGSLAVLVLSTPAVASSHSTKTIVKFSCHGGKPLKAVFAGKEATVTYDKTTRVLPQSRTADGFLYSTSKYSLRGKGDRVTWTVRGKKPVNCRTR